MPEEVRPVDYKTVKTVKDGTAYYKVRWSPVRKVQRYAIQAGVPAMPGIFELYYRRGQDDFKLFYMERVWYGGLRAEIRRATDPANVPDRLRRGVLENEDCFYRFTIVESKADLKDLLHRYSEMLLPSQPPPAASGRYEQILIADQR